MSDIPDLTFSMDPDEEKHILYEKTEVWTILTVTSCFDYGSIDEFERRQKCLILALAFGWPFKIE